VPGDLGTVSVRPSAPVLAAVTPATGSTTTPLLTGTSWADTTITLYAGTTCSGTAIGSGTAAELAGAGIAATVPTDATTTISATATDLASNTSECSDSVGYTHATPSPPVTDPPVVLPPAPCTAKPASPKAKRSSLALRVTLNTRGLLVTEKTRGKVTITVARQAPCAFAATLKKLTVRATGKLKRTIAVPSGAVAGTRYTVTVKVGKRAATATVVSR